MGRVQWSPWHGAEFESGVCGAIYHLAVRSNAGTDLFSGELQKTIERIPL